MFNYDKVITSLGDFGPYQKRICFFLFVISIPNGINVGTVVFQNLTPNFRCAVPGLHNDSFQFQNAYHESLVKATIPHDSETGVLSECKIYALEDAADNENGYLSGANKTRTCHKWVYDTGEEGTSRAVQFDLVCDRALYKAHYNMMILLGILAGSLVGGALSDFFGRKKMIIASVVLASVFGTILALMTTVPPSLLFTFLVSMTLMTKYISVFVMLVEIVGKSKRGVATLAATMGYTTGLFVSILLNYFIRDSRIAILLHYTPFILFGGFWWLIDESPRWLLTKKRYAEAQAIIVRIAKINGVKYNAEMKVMTNNCTDPISKKSEDSDAIFESDVSTSSSGGDDHRKEGGSKLMHYCCQPKIAARIALLCFSWITVNMVYYGLVLGVGDLIPGDIFVNFTLQAAMETLSYLMCLLVLERFDRKKIFCVSMILSGASVLGISVLVLTESELRSMSILMYCLGKLFITNGFNLVYIITTELLPTVIRNSGLGFCSCTARVSGVALPYIVSASLHIPGPLGKAFPLIIFGALSVMSGLSSMLLPETRNATLQENFDDDSKNDVESESKDVTAVMS